MANGVESERRSIVMNLIVANTRGCDFRSIVGRCLIAVIVSK